LAREAGYNAGCFRWMPPCTCSLCATERIRSSANRLPTITAPIGCGLRSSGGCCDAAPPRPPPCCGTSNL